jgi:hypothetical protein
MKFNLIQPISCGNAVRLVLQATAGETRWRVLRKETNGFTGHDDPGAFLVHDGDERFLTDARLLVNGVTYHYALYGFAMGVWGAPVVATVVPEAKFTDVSVDAQELVRERLDVALHSMIARGLAPLSKPTVSVMSIPFYTQGGELPVVTVLYAGGSATGHALGAQMSGDEFDGSDFIGTQGWHESITLEISAWSLNAQERNTIRKALQAAIAANLGVFAESGLMNFEVQSVQDTEDTQSMNAPIYQTVIRVGCQVVCAVTEIDNSFGDIVISSLGV